MYARTELKISASGSGKVEEEAAIWHLGWPVEPGGFDASAKAPGGLSLIHIHPAESSNEAHGRVLGLDCFCGKLDRIAKILFGELGKRSTISAKVMPLARFSSKSSTGMRVPAIQGLPNMMSGCAVMAMGTVPGFVVPAGCGVVNLAARRLVTPLTM